MSAAQCLHMDQSLWTDKLRYDDAESKYQEFLAKSASGESQVNQTDEFASAAGGSSLVSEIAKAREQIKQSLSNSDVSCVGVADGSVVAQIQTLQAENRELRKVTDDLAALVKRLDSRVAALEGSGGAKTAAKETVSKPVAEDEDEDDFELFGDDDEEEEDDAESERVKQERIDAYNTKKSKKTAIIAKSSVLLDVKPWDDETDMKALEDCVKTIKMDGLLWGASKLVPLAYGIKKLSIVCIVEDDKVSIEELSEQICEFEDFVQSVDIAAFNKI